MKQKRQKKPRHVEARRANTISRKGCTRALSQQKLQSKINTTVTFGLGLVSHCNCWGWTKQLCIIRTILYTGLSIIIINVSPYTWHWLVYRWACVWCRPVTAEGCIFHLKGKMSSEWTDWSYCHYYYSITGVSWKLLNASLRHVSSGTIVDVLLTAGILFLFLFLSRSLTSRSISAHLCCCRILPKSTAHRADVQLLVLITIIIQE